MTKRLIDRFNEAPKLNATIRLDNFLQMQYEIIAKQLTLLRDEVGPGERIVFLEMPQSVNASYDKANNKWAQSWWKVLGYTLPREQPKTIMQSLIAERDKARDPAEDETDVVDTRRIVKDALQAVSHELQFNKTVRSGTLERCVREFAGARVAFVQLDCGGDKQTKDGLLLPQDSSVRTIELIPRQSSLNVNDIKLRARTGVLTAVAKTLFGVGARLNFQRQRESFSQFVQQELYSSGFGKGSTEFGGPLRPCRAPTE